MSTDTLKSPVDDGSGLASELVVIGSMALVSGATGMASFLHAGLSSEAAAAVSVATLSLFMMGHVALSRRSAAPGAAPTARPRTRKMPDRQNRVTLGLPEDAPAARPEAASRVTLAPADEQQGQPEGGPDRLSETLAKALAQQDAEPTAPQTGPQRSTEPQNSSWTYRAAAETPAQSSARVAPAVPQVDRQPVRTMPIAHELPEMTPTIDELTVAPPPLRTITKPAAPAPSKPMAGGPPPVPPTAKRDESEMISGLLKRLAAQIETGQKPPSAPLEPSPAVAWARENFENDGRNLETIDDAVDALQSAVGSMRASLEGAAQQPTAAPVARDPARERLEAIADAIATERMDVMLEPILGLKQHRAQHFSVSVRLRTLNGDVLEPANVIAAAGGTGLLSMFDALRVKRASGVAARLDSNGRPGSVFSGVSGEGVIGDALLRDVERGRAQGEVLPERLVLTFSQEDVRLFTPGQWRTITSLRDLGFRFALENVTHLGMDFEGLVAIGFTFVKLDASVFLQGLPHGAGMLPASDVCRHFAGLGMAVVVTGIEEETVHARVMGFGALLGQGSLFGAPRPVKSGPPRGTTAAYA